MFHLIRKYSNRKLYDIATRAFLRQEDLLMLVIEGEDVRIEDNDSRVDITTLELQKAFVRFPELQKMYIAKRTTTTNDNTFFTETDFTPPTFNRDIYIPAEIRLLDKSLEYFSVALRMLSTEPPYNASLHEELVAVFLSAGKRLEKIKKKHRLV